MSKSLITLTAILVFTTGTVAFAADDDLFSNIRTNLVFDSVSGDRAGSSSIRTITRITDSETLRDLLKAVGFEAKVGSDRAVITEKKLDKWTFPVLAVIAEDEASVNIVLGLSTIKDVSKELTSEILLKLMAASQENAPAMFSYHGRRQRTELSLTLKNRDLTGQTLRDEINRLAIIAKNNETIWETPQASTASPPTPVTTPAPSVSTSATLVGKWSAAKSDKEAFAVEFTESGKFNLVYIKDGNQTKSSGTFAVADGSLTLNGTDGLKLQGKLTISSKSEFRFQPKDATELIFARAK